jgi:hypothetical protein
MPNSELPNLYAVDGPPLTASPHSSAPAQASAEEEPISLWLYLAGLCVTLSGLYAVNFDITDRSFASLTYGLALGGYLTSYLMRACRLPLKAVQYPLIAALIVVFFSGISSDRGLGWLAPPEVADNRAKSLQLVFAWLAIIHTFTLTANAAILFACVPCMTMIALVSTTTTEPQVQNAFLLFICSATFLMVHENYLRTRQAIILGRNPATDRRMFAGQLQLAAFCFFAALILANLVAVPIRSVGQRLFLPTSISPLASSSQKLNNAPTTTVQVKERNSVELATGPVSQSDAPLLRVRSDRGLYWRGTTFDFYTGHSFENRTGASTPLEPLQDTFDRTASYTDFSGGNSRQEQIRLNRFRVPESPYELKDSDMRGSAECVQEITVVGGVFSQFYGAGSVRKVDTTRASLKTNPAGSLDTDTLPNNTLYLVTSQVPVTNDDADTLRAASGVTPPAVQQVYLQVAPDGGQENLRLRDLAKEITKGQKTAYDKVVALQRYIDDTCKYNLNAPAAPRTKDTVEYFLFESKEGYCDSFGAALTMLCRYAGIPARLASGFLTGDLDGNVYTVREKHKHIWTEVFFPHVGWVTFDATEGAEDISEARKKPEEKTGFGAWLLSHGWLPPTLGLLILGILAYLLKTEVWDRFRRRGLAEGGWLDRPPTNQEIVRLYLSACATLARRGYARPPSATADEFAQYMARTTPETLPGMSDALERLTTLHTRFRYGPEVASADDVSAAQDAAEAITTLLADAKKRRPAIATAQT